MMKNTFKGMTESTCDPDGEIKDEDKEKSWTLSGELWAVTSKFDGKGEKPVPEAKMAALAEYVAYLKELPSQAMFVDFHLDKYFNTTNTKCKFTRGIIPLGGPLEGYKNDGDER